MAQVNGRKVPGPDISDDNRAGQNRMELECAKYHDKVSSDEPVCAHPGDYCQFRSSCMIHFMEGELRRSRKGKAADSGATGAAKDNKDDDRT